MRTLLAALAASLVAAFSSTAEPLVKDDKFLDNQELIISVGTYPCVFKIGEDFYDYTPFKLVAADQELNPEARYYMNPEY